MPSALPTRTGLLLGAGAYALWGLLPLYLKLLNHVPADQLLSHRVLWSVLLLAVIVLAFRRLKPLLAALNTQTILFLLASSALIGVNWLVYIYAIQHGHVLEASLGYFINPLVNVLLGVTLLKERLRRWQGVAVAVAAVGVLVLAISGGGSIWISLTLALSFGLYGLVRKVVAIDALGGLTVETLLLAPICAAVVIHAANTGQGAWGQALSTDLLLSFAGLATATPLLMFAAAARRMPLTTLGLLQYIAPSIQFVLAVTVFGELVHTVHFVTFSLIWSGCALFAWDSLRATRGETDEDIKPNG